MKFKRQILTILILSLPILAIAAGWLFLSKETPQPLFDPLTWKGLTPGASTKADVLQIFGQPETPRNVGIDKAYFYTYYDLPDTSFAEVEFLFEKGSSLETQKVRGITLKYGSNLESTSSARLEGFSVENSLRQYGKPNLVLWGNFTHERFIAWTNRGFNYSPKDPFNWPKIVE